VAKKQSFRSALDRFVLASEGEFRLEDLLNYARSRIRTDPPDLDKAATALLYRHPGVFHDEERDVYITRSAFFRNAVFRIVPIELEIDQGALVFGHRTIPFGPYGADANDATLMLQGGREIKRKKVNWTVDQYRQFYTLLGPEIMMQSLLLSDSANASRLAGEPNPGTRLRLTVFDLETVYKEHGFKPGDALILKVIRFAPPRYELTVQKTSEMLGVDELTGRWERRFNKALGKAFDLLGPNTVAYEQISLACFLAGRTLLEDPFGSPLLSLRSSSDLELQALETHSFIWPKGRDLDVPPSAKSYYPVQVGDSDSLEEILEDTAAPVPAPVVEAYMRDALFHGQQDLDPVVDRTFGSLRTPEFYDDSQRQAFDKHIRRLWKDVRAAYSRTTDHYAGKCRALILAAIDEYFSALADFEDDDLSDEQEDLIRSAIPLLRSTYAFLESLNVPSVGLGSLDRDLLTNAQETAAEIHDLARKIALTPRDPSIRSRHADEAPTHSLPAVRIKVTLEGVDPAVWRRLLMPAASTLADLHTAIQAAFYWEDLHSHFFLVGKRRYSDTEQVDGRTMDEEAECFLDELRPDHYRFSYVYGFEGTWKHSVEIEDVKAPSLGFPYPVCLGGQRACPPEDCDPEAYPEISNALKNPEDPRHPALFQWAGYPFDPEGFDSNVVNRRLIEQFEGLSGSDDLDEEDDFDDDELEEEDWEEDEEDEHE